MDEWSPLREIIVGTLQGFKEHNHYSSYHSSNKFINTLYDEAEEGLQTFQTLLEKEGVIVHRPRGFCYNVRDCAVVLGDTIVDQYINCEPLGMSAEAPLVVLRELEAKKFIGGAEKN